MDVLTFQFPGQIWLTERVERILTDAGITGVGFAPATITGKCQIDYIAELLVHGQAWRLGSTPKNIRVCDVCGRTKFPSRKFVVDQERWDGSDVFHLDANPNMVFVTARVVKLFDQHDIANIGFQPIGPGLPAPRW